MKSLESFYDSKQAEASMSESQALPYDETIRKKEFHTISKFSEFLNNPQMNNDNEVKQYGLPIFWELI